VPRLLAATAALQIDDVVDGKQRLTTLYHFKQGVYLSGEEFRLQASVLLGAVGAGRTSGQRCRQNGDALACWLHCVDTQQLHNKRVALLGTSPTL
jgi:hypothetical protein